ncbi:MAG TPA: flagellar hook-length control protein FliK [Spirochaetota bacterium]|nr:flagellar hook-length control protein FliK [Spirochaetota bacterium]
MVGHIKSSGIENTISAISADDRRDNSELKSGGDFLSILKSSADFKETRTAEREETIQKPFIEDKSPVSVKTENQAGPIESAFNSRQNQETLKGHDSGETGSSLKSAADRADKTDARKKNPENREEQRDKSSDIDSLAAAGESLVRKSISVKFPQTVELKSTGEKLAAALHKEAGKSAIGQMLKTDSPRVNLKDEGIPQKNGREIRSGINDLLEAAGKGTGKNSSPRKGMEQGRLIPNELRESTAALSGYLVKEKVKDERGISLQKHKPAEAAVSDKKNIESGEAVQQRQKFTGEQSAFGKGAGSGSDSGRDNSQLFTVRSESAARHTTEKTGSMNKMPEFRQSLQEIMDKAKVTISDSRNGSFTVKLFPKELGSVNVNLIMENGVVNGRFLVDNNDAKTLLLSSIENLIDELQQSGVSVGEFSVDVRDERERFIREKDENKYKINPVFSGNKEAATAADVYDYNSVYKHNGSINMII